MPTDDALPSVSGKTITSIFASVDALVRKRAVRKSKITIAERSIDVDSSRELIDACVESIKSHYQYVQEFDMEINELMLVDCINQDELNARLNKEVEDQANYECHVKLLINQLTKKPVAESTNVQSVAASSRIEVKLPHLKCASFSGENSAHLEYFSFITQFQNVVGMRENISKCTKFTYLKSYLSGYALKLVQHLQVTADNYDTALELLEIEFLNKEAVVDSFIEKLLSLRPKPDRTYLESKVYINEVRCVLSDLKLNGVDVMSEHSAKLIVSHVVFTSLPVPFQHELISKLGTSYPSIDQIFDSYVDVVRTLNLKSDSFANFRKPNFSSKFHDKSSTQASASKKVSTNFSTDERKSCKFCACTTHTMLNCTRYSTLAQRKKRCAELKICNLCSSTKHDHQNCKAKLDYPCKSCKSHNHISALCPGNSNQVSSNVCLNTSHGCGNQYLLPTLTINIARNGKTTSVRCLVDSGSQRSYLSHKILDRIRYPSDRLETVYHVNSFVKSGSKSLSEASLEVDFSDGLGYFQLPFLIDKNFQLSFSIDKLNIAMQNFDSGILADSQALTGGDEVKLEGILGTDSIQFFGDFKLVKCMSGSAFSLHDRLIPFGDIEHFLTKDQVSSVALTPSIDPADSTLVNFALNPVASEFDPISSVISESQVEGNLERMFKVESVGLKDEGCELPSGDPRVEDFASKIVHRDGRYFVDLPWYPDKLSKVKNNFNVAKAVLDRVVADLYSRNLYDAYSAVFEQQINDGVLEEVSLDEINVENHVWIPHRAVVKTESQVTTKVRPVLNCSMKRGNDFSLNEAAFPGVDLLQKLLSLLIKVRHDDFLVISDVKSAFLQIKLKSERDKNMFSILWKDPDGKLRAYRYTTLVFGYSASPFILNFVIRHHVSQFPFDACRSVLENNLYVDNLFITGNDFDELNSLYKGTRDLMHRGGFVLRSWASNCDELNGVFAADSTGVTHDCDNERVLGYRYFPGVDSFSLAEGLCESEEGDVTLITKRTILSEFSKLFDPLGAVLPITIRGKILLRKIWKSGCSWDEPVTDEIKQDWIALGGDLQCARSIRFKRRALSGNGSIDLIIFCDSSKDMFGCSFYAVENGVSTLLFAKSKVAPIKSKSLPTLELLSVFLAFKCLDSVLDSLNTTIKSLHFGVDSQIVLSWILSEKVKTKNIFARNRVNDITNFRTLVLHDRGLECKFHYVPTGENPADMVTRGLSFTQFESRYSFWFSGPSFLSGDSINWPDAPLNCLSEESRMLTTNVAILDSDEPLLEISKYSSVDKLFRVTALVLQFIGKLRKNTVPLSDRLTEAKLYWIKHEQKLFFHDEFKYLQSSDRDNKIPNLINNLNVFEENGVLRSRGRLDKCILASYDICNPIILPKRSPLTGLLIWDSHRRCNHLGVSSTLNDLRGKGLWIPQGRAVVKSVISSCVTCKRYNSMPFKYPNRTQYIADRVNFTKPFNHVGVDHTGQFPIKIGGVVSKFYIIIFTCLNIRAIHLELVEDLTTKSFLLAFIKFCNFHCTPSKLYSDNASNFLQGADVLSKSSLDDELSAHLLKNHVKHIRIPLYSPWAGSYWERLIKTVKMCINKTIGRKQMDYFSMSALLTDVQTSVNNRPLTYRDHADKNFEVITPNSFLKMLPHRVLMFGDVDSGITESLPGRRELVDTLVKREDMFSFYRDMFYQDYLLSLRETSYRVFEEDWFDRIKVGDVVLISSSTKSRSHWQMGRVTKLLTGSDGKTRHVNLIRCDRTEGTYSVCLLYPLELSLSESTVAKDGDTSDVTTVQRPVRAAARKCREALKMYN